VDAAAEKIKIEALAPLLKKLKASDTRAKKI
jgi:hypothetical protein